MPRARAIHFCTQYPYTLHAKCACASTFCTIDFQTLYFRCCPRRAARTVRTAQTVYRHHTHTHISPEHDASRLSAPRAREFGPRDYITSNTNMLYSIIIVFSNSAKARLHLSQANVKSSLKFAAQYRHERTHTHSVHIYTHTHLTHDDGQGSRVPRIYDAFEIHKAPNVNATSGSAAATTVINIAIISISITIVIIWRGKHKYTPREHGGCLLLFASLACTKQTTTTTTTTMSIPTSPSAVARFIYWRNVFRVHRAYKRDELYAALS